MVKMPPQTFQVAASRNRNRLELFSGEAGGCRLYYGDRQANVPVFLDPDQVHYPLGSFISRPKTALVYGGIPEESPQPLSVLISDDAGEHWISGDLSAAAQKGESFHQRLVGFSTRLEGWILLGGRGGSTGQRLYGYLTSDGGQSWQELSMPEPARTAVVRCFYRFQTWFCTYFRQGRWAGTVSHTEQRAGVEKSFTAAGVPAGGTNRQCFRPHDTEGWPVAGL